MVRTFAECKKIYKLLNQVDFDGLSGKDWCVAALRIKWLSVITNIIYPQYKNGVHRYHITEEMRTMDGNIDIAECGDYLLQCGIINGEVADYALSYMSHSPFWRVTYDYARVYSPEEDGEYDYEEMEKSRTEMDAASFLEPSFECFFEEGFFKSEQRYLKADKLLEVFELYEESEVTDELCAIRSDLYPYVKKAREVAGEDCKEIFKYIELAYRTIRNWLGLCNVYFDTPKAAYFFAADGSASIYEGWSGYYGALEFDPAIIICAELIESALFEIHSKYPFLSKEILDKKEVNKL